MKKILLLLCVSILTFSQINKAEVVVSSNVLDVIGFDIVVENIETSKNQTIREVISKLIINKQQKEDILRKIKKITNINNQIKYEASTTSLISVNPENNFKKIIKVNLPLDSSTAISVMSEDGINFDVNKNNIKTIERKVMKNFIVESSLYQDAINNGIPVQVVNNTIDVIGWSVDLQRSIYRGDNFSVIYTEVVDENGNLYFPKNIEYIKLKGIGKNLELYSYTDSTKKDFYDSKGASARKSLLKTPLNGARLTSKFGKRKHPVLGYTRLHKGIDFAAPIGTPIYAAGDGIVEFAGYSNSFGNFVRIRHLNSYRTTYAHMTKIAKGIKQDVKVKQRRVIGYLGNTGMSTGPHLHYEVSLKNKQVNPLSLKSIGSENLNKTSMAQFQKVVDKRKQEIAAFEMGTQNILSSNDIDTAKKYTEIHFVKNKGL